MCQHWHHGLRWPPPPIYFNHTSGCHAPQHRPTGRPCAWHILNYLKTVRSLQIAFARDDVHKLTWLGGERLADFYYEWHRVTHSLQSPLDVCMIQELVLAHLRRSQTMAYGVAGFDRRREGPDERCVEYLTRTVEGVMHTERIAGTRTREMQARRPGRGQAALARPNAGGCGGKHNPQGAAPPDPKGKAQPKGRDRGRGNGGGR